MISLVHRCSFNLSAWVRNRKKTTHPCFCAFRFVRLAAIVSIASISYGCFVVDAIERARQLRTYTNMQAITARIEAIKQTKEGAADPTDPRIQEALKSVAGGYDEWGHPFLFRGRRVGRKFSYVLVSIGKDGKLDVKSLDVYFDAPETMIQGMVSRDIVFRDGVAVNNAGK